MIKRIAHSFLHLIYPPLCLHCKEGLKNPDSLLCPHCLQLLELINPFERCPICFGDKGIPVCSKCLRKGSILVRTAAAFEYLGPSVTLITQLKYGNKPYLTKGAGGYMAAQFLRMEWPSPDVIIPVPIQFMHRLERGYNQSLLLAQVIGEILNCPVQEALQRRSGDYSQAGLSKAQRMQLSGSNFILKKGQNLEDKRILLIDDVITTGSTLERCAESLQEDCPLAIYGLALCKA